MLNDLPRSPPSCVALQDEACSSQLIGLYSNARRPLNSEGAAGVNLDEQVAAWGEQRGMLALLHFSVPLQPLLFPLMLMLLSMISGPSSHHPCLETASILTTEGALGLYGGCVGRALGLYGGCVGHAKEDEQVLWSLSRTFHVLVSITTHPHRHFDYSES